MTWTSAGRIGQQLLQFGLMIYLMRALGPKAFGLVAIVTVFTGFARAFTDFGFSAALVQRQDSKEEHRSSAFWFSLLGASTLAVILCVASGWIATFYEEELLGPITVWMALGLILGAFGAVPRALLQKALRFKTLVLIDSCGLLVGGSAAIAAALLGAGVWCLVIQQLVGTATVSGGLLVMGGWRPRWMWSRPAFTELLGFGAGLTGFGVINYWARSADKLLIGAYFGPVALGVYSRAYSLMLLPITQFIRVLAPVMFPALSTIQDDKPRVRAAFLRALNLLTFATFPMMTGLYVVAEPFVLGLFGAEWAEVVPLIQILSFVGVTQSVCNPTGWLYLSQGRTDWMFRWGVFSGGFLVLTIVLGVWFGSSKRSRFIGTIQDDKPHRVRARFSARTQFADVCESGSDDSPCVVSFGHLIAESTRRRSSKWGSRDGCGGGRREPGGRPEMLPGTGRGGRFSARTTSARRCCVLLRDRGS